MLDSCNCNIISALTFPYSGKQIQTIVCVQSLQQVPQALRVWVVHLETQSIINYQPRNESFYVKIRKLSSHLTFFNRFHMSDGFSD